MPSFGITLVKRYDFRIDGENVNKPDYAAARIVVLDRDGVINIDTPGKYVTTPEEWRIIPGSAQAIERLNACGFRVVVVSNQSGIGRGLFSLATLDAIHQKMHSEIAAEGGRIERVYYCPHLPTDGCDCRKPRPGMLRNIEKDFATTLAGAPFIGDKWSDIGAANAVAARAILVGTGYGQATLLAHAAEIREFYKDLAAAVDALCSASD